MRMARQLATNKRLISPTPGCSSRSLPRPWRKAAPHPRRRSLAPSAALSVASASLPLVLGWSHTVTSGSYHGASLWYTTLCALSIALGALSYNLMAVLSEFFNFGGGAAQEPQARTYLHGVDVTASRFFRIPAVLAAVDFAAAAHAHQRRKTGQPYVSHCIETALIVEACLPPAVSSAEQDRHVACIMAAVLHDVLDDTPADPAAMAAAFGPRVTSLVGQVSKLSQMNQLLRRGKRQGWAQYSPDHFKQLRKLIVDLAFEEPLVILVKLADRLHNMRTVYVLPPDKAAAVAEETLEVWCSMAESLGWDGLKSEMEDLCFAVLQPSTYCTLRAELDRMWSLPSLAVVEAQLGEAEGAAAGGGGGGGGGDDGLGLKIVQVTGPAAPVRTYTRAAGVRAAASASAPTAAAAASPATTERRRRRGWRRDGTDSPPPPAALPETPDSAAVDAVVAAAAVPLPLPWLPKAELGLVATSQGESSSTSAAATPARDAVADAVARPSAMPTAEQDGPAAVAYSGSSAGGGGASSASAGSPAWSHGLSAAASTSSSPPPALSLAPVPTVNAAAAFTLPAEAVATPSVGTQGAAFAVAANRRPDARGSGGCSSGAGCGPSSSTVGGAAGDSDYGGSDRSGSGSCSGSGSKGGSWDGGLEVDPGGTSPRVATAEAPASADVGESLDPAFGSLESIDGPLLPGEFVLPAFAASAPPVAAAAAAAAVAGGGSPSSSPGPPRPDSSDVVSATPSTSAAAGISASSAAATSAAASASPAAPTVSPLSDTPPPESLPLAPLTADQERLRLILSTVVPFESVSFKSLRGLAGSARRGLEVLDECAALLYDEIQIRSQAGGLGIDIQGRLKSLHSAYRKMVRKGVAVAQVYDSRALRVIVDDGDGSQLAEAVASCYRLVGAVHSLWKPIKREFDDYIANPKRSGYQALHTAVRGPGGIPMEVQIKTSSMHELAEYGAAAHWVYKEGYTPELLAAPPPPAASVRRRRGGGSSGGGGGAGGGGSGVAAAAAALPPGYVGQPVLKVARDKLRYGVIVDRDADGRRLVAAVKLGPTFPPHPARVPYYGFYSGLLSYARAKGWAAPGRGDLVLRLEEFVQCDDGRFHRRDHMGYLIPAETVTLLDGFEEDAAAAAAEAEAAEAAAAGGVTPAGGGGEAAAGAGASSDGSGSSVDVDMLSSVDEDARGGGIGGGTGGEGPEARRLRQQMRATFAKTQQLRSMIEWGRGAVDKYSPASSPAWASDEVSVLVWPGGHIEHWARGATAGDVVAAQGRGRGALATTGEGYDGYRVKLLVNVNNRLVPEDTVLNDGDLVILAREKVRI